MFHVWNKKGELDLHDMSAAAANAVLDVILHEIASGERAIGDLTVITGRGRRSGSEGPVLMHSTREFLREQFDPSLEITDIPDNPGRFVLEATTIQNWVERGHR